jgi:hypothetical protein
MMDIEARLDEVIERVEALATRLENIEFVLGVTPTSADPLLSVNLDEIRDRLTVLEMATGANGY